MKLSDLEVKISFLIAIGKGLDNGKSLFDSAKIYRNYIDSEVEEGKTKSLSDFQELKEETGEFSQLLGDYLNKDLENLLNNMGNSIKYHSHLNHHIIEKMLKENYDFSTVLAAQNYKSYIVDIIKAGERGGILASSISQAVDFLLEERRFCLHKEVLMYEMFANLVDNAVPILEALNITSSAVSDPYLKSSLNFIESKLKNGGSLYESMLEQKFDKETLEIIKKFDDGKSEISESFRKIALLKRDMMNFRL